MKNILIIGCYHSLNSGVMAMAESIVQQFPTDAVTILTSDQHFLEDKERYSHYSNVSLYAVEWFGKSLSNYIKLVMGLVGISLYKNFNEIIKKTDLVIDISGDSISADYGTRSMFFSLFPAYLISNKVPLLYGPQTVGPFRTSTQKYLAKRAFNNSKGVFLREEVSLEFLKEININISKSHSDLAFLLKPKTSSVKLPINTVGIGVSALIKKFGKENSEQLFKTIIEICLKTGYNVLLITHVDTLGGSDVKFGKSLKEKYFENNNKVIFLNRNYIASEWKYIIGQCNGVISARMHPVVQAISQSIPSLNISYNHKSIGVVEKRFYPHARVVNMMNKELLGEVEIFLSEMKILKEDKKFKDKTLYNISLAIDFIEETRKYL